MNNTLIITGGDIDFDFASQYIEKNEFDFIIAVDGGLVIADRLSIVPNYIIGDFDTVSPLLLFKYEKMEDVVIKRYRPEKDDTDTKLAMRIAIEENSFCIHILGGFGSRIDHTLANILLLQPAIRAGIEAVMVNKQNRVRLLGYKRKSIELNKSESIYKYVSLIPMSESVKGISARGMKYNLSNYDFYLDKQIGLGVSNELAEDVAEISISEGKLLLIESRDEDYYGGKEK